ncbi:hypothetical protein B5X24_HaOG215181 [Helicoverpa armigera]|nr:hypothetical protein B5X24_HaOG215181 [Helicoverpa armigera]
MLQKNFGTTTTHLTVVRVNSDPTPVKDHQVPVFLYSRHSFVADQWDLTTNQLYFLLVRFYINSFVCYSTTSILITFEFRGRLSEV